MSDMKPEIRFEGFTDNWEQQELQELGTLNRGVSKHRPRNDKKLYGGKYPFIQTGDVAASGIYLNSHSQTYNEYGIAQSRLWGKGTLLITIAANIAESAILDINAAFPDSIIGFETKENNVLFIKFSLDRITKTLKEKAETSSQSNLNLASLSGHSINVTSRIEQDMIAIFLKKVDNSIALNQSEIKKITQFKQAMLQKMFPEEGEKTPKVRFEGFDAEWEKMTLGEVGTFQTSSVDKLIEESESLVNLVNYMDVYKQREIYINNIHELMTVSAKDNQIVNNNLLRGDILFTPSSETSDDIGHSMVIQENLPNTLYSYHLLRFRPDISLDIIFSNYFCNIEPVRSQIIKKATGSTRYTVGIKVFLNIEVKIPSNIEEQQKIGEFFQNIDKSIKSKKSELTKFKQFKQAILNKIFI